VFALPHRFNSKQTVSELVSLSSGHKKIVLYSVPGREPFYKKLGFKRMRTAMAIFENQGVARRVLVGLEAAWPRAECEELLLETGPYQPEALAFYSKQGYTRRGPFVALSFKVFSHLTQ
jgi:ribosomal protein S18 acetylase RimI-like enzyme